MSEASPGPSLRRVLLLVGAVVAAVVSVGIGARAEHDARVTADEPQYLLSAISLAEDGDLNIRDELNDHRWSAFHEAPLPQQTAPLDGGRTRLSPHDPLYPLVLALPVRIGLGVAGDAGAWVAAKAFGALVAAALAMVTTWVAVRRFGVGPRRAAVVVTCMSVVPPLVVYGTQLYPELLAALAVVSVIGAVTSEAPARPAPMAVLLVGLLALPWLSVKYLPVAMALGVVALVRLWRADARLASAVLVAAGAGGAAAFALVHRAVYGGWTAYAAGDHFVGGELTVVGVAPDYLGRSVRVIGLLVDRDFGLAAWAPVFLFAVPAAGALLRRRPPGWAALVVPMAAGWLTATFVALTMHGWWWPGRQVVAVLPTLVLTTAWGAEVLAAERPRVAARVRALFWVAAAFGIVTWAWLLGEVLTRRRQLIIDFAATAAPLSAQWRALLPDGRAVPAPTGVQVAWAVILGAAVALGWWAADPNGRVGGRPWHRRTAAADGSSSDGGRQVVRAARRVKDT